MGRKKKELKQLEKLPLAAIAPGGVSRQTYGENGIEDMARALADAGMRDPLLVKQTGREGRYGLISGGRRYLAAKRLGWKTVDCLVLDGSLKEEIRVLEKLRKEDFTPWEMADALLSLKEKLDCTQSHLGQAIGRTRDFVANLLALTHITPETRSFILSQQDGNRLTARHLRYVGRAAPATQIRIARHILDRHLSTTELERDQRGAHAQAPDYHIPGLRPPRPAEGPQSPRNLKEWKKYQRQLSTDLRRIARHEAQELRRAQRLMVAARERQRLVKRESGIKRRELLKELRRTKKEIGG